MTRRTREVMFRIGGEEDLLDRPTVAPAPAPQPDSAPIPIASEPPSTPWRAGRPLDADIPLAPGVPEQPTEILTASATKVLDAPALENPPRPVQSMEPSPATVPDTSTSGVPAPAPPRSPRAHQHHDAGRRDRSTASPTRRQHLGLTRLHSWIAWVNALILTVLIVAAVIGHDPPSTTAVGRASSTTQAAARPVDSSSNTGSAMSKLPPRPLIREHRGPPSHLVRHRPHLTVASREPTRRSPSASIPQRYISPPVVIARRVASSPSAAPAPTSATPTANHPRADAKDPRGNPSVEFAP